MVVVYSIDPKSSPDFLLFIFSEGCKACDQNWDKWNSLLLNHYTKMPILFLSIDNKLSKKYINDHANLGL